MKITLRNRNLSAEQCAYAFIETRLLALAGRCRVDDAVVMCEKRTEDSPPFRVVLQVAVSGPDLTCEACDFTPLRAFTRAMDEIESRLSDRAAKRSGRLRRRSLRTARARVGGSHRR